ncbi:MAG: hypothetical protein IPM79_08285 [Polyangiaceae bacterium]|nr:hypothetical protein [Polyangiaceae bacterium]
MPEAADGELAAAHDAQRREAELKDGATLGAVRVLHAGVDLTLRAQLARRLFTRDAGAAGADLDAEPGFTLRLRVEPEGADRDGAHVVGRPGALRPTVSIGCTLATRWPTPRCSRAERRAERQLARRRRRAERELRVQPGSLF